MAMRRLAPAARRAAIGAILPQRLHRQTTLSSVRGLSLMPWRKSNASVPPLPVYFSTPESAQHQKPIRRYFVRFLYLSTAFYICHQLYLGVIDLLTEEAGDELDSHSKQAEDEEAEIDSDFEIFLPMPFIISKINQPPYQKTDPDWMELQAFTSNASLLYDAKLLLVDVLLKHLVAKNIAPKWLGGREILGFRAWLDASFPNQPPPKHYIAGISLSESEGLSWKYKLVDPMVASRLAVVLYPKAAAKAAWTFVTVLCKSSAQNAATFLGLGQQPSQQPSLWHSVVPAAAQLANTSAAPAGNPKQELMDSVLPPFLQDIKLPQSFMHAKSAATERFLRSWSPPRRDHTPHCITFEGLINIEGRRAVATVYVRALFDVRRNVFIQIRWRNVEIKAHEKYPPKK